MRINKCVVILYKSLPQYRKPFFELLKQRLEQVGIDLILVYGDGSFEDRKKGDLVQIYWAKFVSNKIISILGHELYWQPVTKYIYGSDLIIVEQASKLLINYYIQLLQVFRLSKLAFWGHGRNFQAKRENILAENVKKIVSKHAVWWFAYNITSKKVVSQLGFPENKITVVQNSIDTLSLKNYLNQISEQDRQNIKKKYNLDSNNICVFCGGMYKDKCLDFLFEAAYIIKQKITDFELFLIGSGIEKDYVEEVARQYEWIQYLGPLFDKDKVDIFSISKLYLMPGLVGLGILDSFTLAVPLVTTDIPIHSPEIEYLENNVNGIMTKHNVVEYADVVTSLLADDNRYQCIKSAALRSSEKYSIENMVENFCDGVLSALGINKYEE